MIETGIVEAHLVAISVNTAGAWLLRDDTDPTEHYTVLLGQSQQEGFVIHRGSEAQLIVIAAREQA